MEKIKHCQICDLQQYDIQKGLKCSLTEKLPKFNNTCPKIVLNEKMLQRIVKVNWEFEDIKAMKNKSIMNFVFFGIIALGVFYFDYYLTQELNSYGVYSTVSIIIFVVGLAVLGMAIGPMNMYYNKKKNHTPVKEELDDLMKLYNISYDYQYNEHTDYFGVKEMKHKLTINGEIFEFENRDMVE